MKLLCCICGMEVNNRNMNINGAAFIEANSDGAIEYCPFCGAKSENLVLEFEEHKGNTYGELDNKTLRILDHAVKLELFNADFYNKAAKLAIDSKIKKMFKDLARIESVHARIHLKLGGFKETPKLRDMDYSRYSQDKDLLEQARLREKHAVEYYGKYMNDVCSEAIREVLRVLQTVEKDHITLLSN
jgi:rubrerythrin